MSTDTSVEGTKSPARRCACHPDTPSWAELNQMLAKAIANAEATTEVIAEANRLVRERL